MSKKTFEKIVEALNEAVAITRGDAKPAKLHIPSEIDAKSIRAKRSSRGMTGKVA